MRRESSWRAPLIPGRGPLAKVPPVAAFLLVAVVFAAGVLTRGVVGAVLLGSLALAVACLLAATWRVMSPGQRLGRVLVLALLLVIALSVL